MSGLGYVFAMLAAGFNGSFTSPYKCERVAKLKLHPILFTQYVSAGVFLSSMVFIPFIQFNDIVMDDDEVGTKFVFSYLGVLAGTLLVIALGAAFLAVDKVGVALAQGVFSGVAILVSYVWGVVIFRDGVSNVGLSVFGIVLLLVGVITIAQNKVISQRVFQLDKNKDGMAASLRESDFELPHTDRKSVSSDLSSCAENTTPRAEVVGMGWALVVGLAGGSVLAPEHYASPQESGLAFIPSFGLGAMIASPVLTFVWFSFVEESPPVWQLRTVPVGLFSGLLWNISNIFAMMAIPSIGYGVAYPILQCALFVAGMWGIFIFREIRGKDIIIFFVGGVVLIIGAVLVALSA